MALTNSAWTNLSAARDRMIGPSYSYIDNVPQTSDLGIGEDGNFDQIATNVRGAFKYVDIMGYTQNPLGDSYLIDSGGMCMSPSGKLEPRKSFVSNIPKGGVLGKGLVGGVMNDVFSLNPMTLYRAMKADATPPCQKYRCQVTNGSNGDTAYITPSLSPDFDGSKCSVIPEPPDADAKLVAEVKRLSDRVSEVQKLVVANPDNTTYKSELSNLQGQLEEAQTDLAGMKGNREKYAQMSKETFVDMSSPMLGGVLLAAIALFLVLRR